jgi:hypothetical protein
VSITRPYQDERSPYSEILFPFRPIYSGVVKYTDSFLIWMFYNRNMNPGWIFGMEIELSLAERRKAVTLVYESAPLIC